MGNRIPCFKIKRWRPFYFHMFFQCQAAFLQDNFPRRISHRSKQVLVTKNKYPDMHRNPFSTRFLRPRHHLDTPEFHPGGRLGQSCKEGSKTTLLRASPTVTSYCYIFALYTLTFFVIKSGEGEEERKTLMKSRALRSLDFIKVIICLG